MASKDAIQLRIDVVTDQALAEINELLSRTDVAAKEVRSKIEKALNIETKTSYQLQVTAQGVKLAKNEVNELTKALELAEKKSQTIGSLTNLRQSLNKAKKDRDAIAQFTQRLEVGADGVARSVRTINSEWAAQQAAVQRIGQQLNAAGGSSFWDRLRSGGVDFQGLLNAGNKLSQFVTIFQALSITIAQIIAPLGALEQGLARLQSFQLSFKAIGVGAQEAAVALEETSRIALGLGVPLNTVRDGFQRLSPVVLQSGGTLKDVSAITEALSSRFAAFGLSADASRRVMNGVIQAFAKGKLQAEELTQQISEADPAFKVDLANAIGVSVQALEQMVKSGEVTTQVLIDVLPELSKAELLFGKMGTSAGSAVAALAQNAVTVEQVRNQIANLNQLSLERLAKIGEPLIVAFLSIQAAVTDFLSNLSKTEAISSLISLLGNLAQSFSVAVQIILKITEAVVFLFQPIAQLLNFLTQFQAVIVGLGAVLAVAIIAKLVAVGAAFKAAIVETAAIAAAVKAAALEYAGLGNSAAGAAAKVAAANATMAASRAAGGATQLSLPLAGAQAAQASQLVIPGLDKYVAQTQQVIAANGAMAASTTTAATGIKGALTSIQASATTTAATTTASFAAVGTGARAAFASVIAGAPAAIGSFIGFAAAVLPIAAAIGAVGIAINTYTSIVNASAEANKQSASTIQAINTALAQQAQATTQIGFNFDSASQKVGQLQAFIDGLRAKFREFFDSLPGWAQDLLGVSKAFADNTAVSAAYKNEISDLANSTSATRSKIQELATAYDQAKNSGDQSAAGIARQNQLYQALQTAINGSIAYYDQQIAAEKSLTLATKEEQQLRDYKVQLLAEERNKLIAVAEASGVTTEAYEDQSSALDTLIAKLKEKAEAEVSDLSEEKEEVRAYYREQIEKNQQAQEAERNRYSRLKEELSAAREASNAYYDAQIEKIRQVRDAEKANADARIRGLQALTSAEAELAALRKQELQEQASKGGREGLEAKAQLERIQANEEIARIQEEERKKEAEAQKAIQALEKQRAEDQAKSKQAERNLDAEHQANMARLEGEARDLVKKQKEEERKIDDEIKSIREGVKDSIAEAGEATKGMADGFGAAAEKADSIYDLMGKIKTLAGQIKIPSTGSRFAGGDVTGGSRYTVNELGKEMFLSRSGKLSWINAPAWGSWTAPGSGTVIPAHIAAGIDLPRSGAQAPGAVTAMTASGGRNGMTKAMVQLINAVNNSRRSNEPNQQASIQAAQAVQIGKLTHAVNKLVEKEWSVGVNIRAQNGGLTYANAVNRKI